MLGDFYRGRMSFEEIKRLPAGEFKFYWVEALNKINSKKGKEQHQMEKLEDEMIDGGII